MAKYLVMFQVIDCGDLVFDDIYRFDTKEEAQAKLDDLFNSAFDEDNNDSCYTRDEAYDGESFDFMDANGDTIIGKLVEC